MKLQERLINGIVTDDGHVLGGQPNESFLVEAANQGFQTVINMRHPSELSWDEEGFVKATGMDYVSIPITSLADMNPANFAAFKDACEAGPAIIHCGSGNRIGAFYALMQVAEGASPQDAFELGCRYGMTGMRPMIEAHLSL